MDKDFDETFRKFFVKIAVYGYNKTKNIPLTPDLINFENCLKTLLPMVERLNDPHVTLDNFSKPAVPSIDEEYLFINTVKKEVVPFVDVEGDKQVDDVAVKALDVLEKIKANGWLLIEPDTDPEPELDDSTESESTVDTVSTVSTDDTYMSVDDDEETKKLKDEVLNMFC